MNRKQKIVLWLGMVIILLMALFPPIQLRRSPRFRRRHDFSSGQETLVPNYSGEAVQYRFILDTGGGTVVLSNLVVQWVIVSIITGSFIYVLKDKKEKGEQDEK